MARQPALAAFRALAATCLISAGGLTALGQPLDLTPCHLDGVSDAARCGWVETPLDYQRPEGPKIKIHVAVLPARSAGAFGDPLLVFAGGPGQAAGDYGRIVEAAFEKVRRTREIVLIDQRGTGRSHKLECDIDGVLNYSALPSLTRACRAGQDLPVEPFTLENVVRDTEEVRRRLGYEKLNVWGGSFGTRTAALYLRRHPERVRTLIVDGVLPPEISLFTAESTGSRRALRLLAEDCAREPGCRLRFPDIPGSLRQLLERAQIDPIPIRLEQADEPTPLVLQAGRDWVAQTLRVALYSSDRASLLPLTIERGVQGDYRPLTALIRDGTRIGKSMALGATLSILCGEEVPRLSPEQALLQSEGSFTGDGYYRFWAQACLGWAAWPPAPDALSPIGGTTPTLVLSGEIDPVTPPELGEIFVRRFPNGRHLVAPGVGHNASPAGCMPDLLARFVETADALSLDASCLDRLRRPAFATTSAGPALNSNEVKP